MGFDIGFGLVRGGLLISVLLSIFLYIYGIERKINIYYSGFALSLSAYVFLLSEQYNLTDVSQFVLVFKLLNTFLIAAGFILVILLRELSKYNNKKLERGLFLFLFLLFILNLAAPYSITFSSVGPGIKRVFVFGAEATLFETKVSVLMIPVVLFMILLGYYAYKTLRYYAKLNEKKETRMLLFSTGLGIGSILVHNFLLATGIANLGFLQYLGVLAFIGIIAQRNIASIVKSTGLSKELIESRERFKKLAESSLEGIVFFENAHVTDINDQFMEMTGFTREDALGKHLFNFFNKASEEKLITHIVTNNPAPFSIVGIKKDSSPYPVRLRVRTIAVDENILSVAYLQDLTEINQTMQELKNSEERFKHLADATFEGIVFTSNWKIVDCNDQLLQLIGFEKEAIIGKNISEVLHSDSIDALQIQLAESSNAPFEIELLSRNGKRIPVEIRSKLMQIENERIRVSVLRDLSTYYKTAKALREANKSLEDVLNSAIHTLIVATDTGGRISLFSKGASNMLGYAPEELIGKATPLIFHDPDEVKSRGEALTGELGYKVEGFRTLTEIPLIRGSEDREWTLIKKDGSRVYVNLTVTPIKNENNEIVRFLGVAVDITSRKISENILKESEEKYKTLMQGMNEAVIQVDNEDRVLFINNKFTEILGYEQEDIVGKIGYEVLLDPDEHHLIIERNKTRLEERGGQYEISFKSKWGYKKEFYLSASPVKDKDNMVVGSIGVMTDMTNMRKADRALKEAMKLLEYVINSVPIAIIAIKDDLEVTQFNKESLKYASFEKSPALFEEDLFTKFPRLKFLKRILDKSIRENRNISEIITIAEEDGEVKFFSVSINLLESDLNPGKVIMIEDITERKKIDQVMIQSEKMLSVAGLAAGMAHEINNPLGTIVQGCQNIIRRTSATLPKNAEFAQQIGIRMDLIEKYFVERNIYEIIHSIQVAAEKSSEIIKNMLQFSRRSESKKVMYSLIKLVDETVELAYSNYDLKKLYDFRSIEIEKIYEPNIPDIRITVTEIQQVVFNILKNAAHALKSEASRHKKPKISVRIKKEPRFLNLEIEDNGPGMDDKVKSRIFEPFFTTKDVGEGTGLGLSVSYMIITTNHQGMLSVDSIPDKGTIFNIRLPYKEEINE